MLLHILSFSPNLLSTLSPHTSHSHPVQHRHVSSACTPRIAQESHPSSPCFIITINICDALRRLIPPLFPASSCIASCTLLSIFKLCIPLPASSSSHVCAPSASFHQHLDSSIHASHSPTSHLDRGSFVCHPSLPLHLLVRPHSRPIPMDSKPDRANPHLRLARTTTTDHSATYHNHCSLARPATTAWARPAPLWPGARELYLRNAHTHSSLSGKAICEGTGSQTQTVHGISVRTYPPQSSPRTRVRGILTQNAVSTPPVRAGTCRKGRKGRPLATGIGVDVSDACFLWLFSGRTLEGAGLPQWVERAVAVYDPSMGQSHVRCYGVEDRRPVTVIATCSLVRGTHGSRSRSRPARPPRSTAT
ncbi:hypothetical protein VTO73DRAFT_4605 [Trametes versicolor]